MAGIQNRVIFGNGFKLQPSSSRDISDMQGLTTDISFVSYVGNPNSNVSANPGSTCYDPVNGTAYIKVSGSGDTGWQQITTLGEFPWTDATSSSYTLTAFNGYITDNSGGVNYTLPASGAIGDLIKIVGKSGLATITPNVNQQILIGAVSGTVTTGTCSSNDPGDCIELICITSGTSTVWRADSVIGTWTLL